jgi:hypothetical protein
MTSEDAVDVDNHRATIRATLSPTATGAAEWWTTFDWYRPV